MGLLKKNIAVGIISLVFAACSNSSNSGESETSISKGDCFDVVNTQTLFGGTWSTGDHVVSIKNMTLSANNYLVLKQNGILLQKLKLE